MQQQTISQLVVMWDQKWILYKQPAMTRSVFGPRRSSKALPKVKLTPKIKKVLVTVQWSDAGLIHYSLLNPSETITSEKYAQQTTEMHQKLKHLQKLQHLQLALVNRKGPILLHAMPNHML